MATGAADGLLRCVFEGCIAASDSAKERRPYHRNCSCALHDDRGCGGDPPCRIGLSYPIRRSWSGSRLVAAAAAAASAPSSPSSSPRDSPDVKRLTRSTSQVGGEEALGL